MINKNATPYIYIYGSVSKEIFNILLQRVTCEEIFNMCLQVTCDFIEVGTHTILTLLDQVELISWFFFSAVIIYICQLLKRTSF